MNTLHTEPAVLIMTLEITRAATGLTETVEIVCTTIESSEGEEPCQQLTT